MPQQCSICEHPDCGAIEKAVIAHQSNRAIARQFSVSKDAVRRHKKAGHIAQALTKAAEAVEVSRADSLLHEVRTLLEQAQTLTGAAQEAGDLRTALQGIGKVKDILELLARLAGEIDNRNQMQINIGTQSLTTSPEWPILLRVLDRHPVIRQELDQALQEAGL